MPSTSTSTVGPVCSAVVALLQAALPDVQIADGRPADSMIQREVVYLGDVNGEERVPVLKGGRKPYEQRYTVEIVVLVGAPRGTLAEVRARSEELRDEVRNAVADDPTVGNVAGVITVMLGAFRQSVFHLAEGPVAEAVQEIEVRARVS